MSGYAGIILPMGGGRERISRCRYCVEDDVKQQNKSRHSIEIDGVDIKCSTRLANAMFKKGIAFSTAVKLRDMVSSKWFIRTVKNAGKKSEKELIGILDVLDGLGER